MNSTITNNSQNINNISKGLSKISISPPNQEVKTNTIEAHKSKLQLGKKLQLKHINTHITPVVPNQQETDIFNKDNVSINSDTSSTPSQIEKESEREIAIKPKKRSHHSLYNLDKIDRLGGGASGEVYLIQDKETKKLFVNRETK